jgi:hypothetical protein
MIYLAIPYGHPDPDIKKYRFDVANIIAKEMISKGCLVFSPISMSHAIECAEIVTGEITHAAWMEIDLYILSKCSELYVVTIDGWDVSKGVRMEMQFAMANNIPIKYVSKYGVIVNNEISLL